MMATEHFGGFTSVENAIIEDANLSLEARMVYLALRRHARPDGSTYVSQGRLAKEVGRSTRRISAHVAELERAWLVEVWHRGKGRTNVYRLLHPIYRYAWLPYLTEVAGIVAWLNRPIVTKLKGSPSRLAQFAASYRGRPPQPSRPPLGRGCRRDRLCPACSRAGVPVTSDALNRTPASATPVTHDGYYLSPVSDNKD